MAFSENVPLHDQQNSHSSDIHPFNNSSVRVHCVCASLEFDRKPLNVLWPAKWLRNSSFSADTWIGVALACDIVTLVASVTVPGGFILNVVASLFAIRVQLAICDQELLLAASKCFDFWFVLLMIWLSSFSNMMYSNYDALGWVGMGSVYVVIAPAAVLWGAMYDAALIVSLTTRRRVLSSIFGLMTILLLAGTFIYPPDPDLDVITCVHLWKRACVSWQSMEQTANGNVLIFLCKLAISTYWNQRCAVFIRAGVRLEREPSTTDGYAACSSHR